MFKWFKFQIAQFKAEWPEVGSIAYELHMLLFDIRVWLKKRRATEEELDDWISVQTNIMFPSTLDDIEFGVASTVMIQAIQDFHAALKGDNLKLKKIALEIRAMEEKDEDEYENLGLRGRPVDPDTIVWNHNPDAELSVGRLDGDDELDPDVFFFKYPDRKGRLRPEDSGDVKPGSDRQP